MQYIQKPKTVDAIIYNGSNMSEVKDFLKDKFRYGKIMENYGRWASFSYTE